MKTKLFVDTEFTGLHMRTTLVSLGIVSDCGATFYAEFTDYDKKQVDNWIQTNVIDNLLFTKHISPGTQSWENWISNTKQYPSALAMDLDNSKDISRFECIGKTEMIRNRLERWLEQFIEIEIWMDVLAYDWALFCDIWDGAFNIPKHIYYIPFDFATWLKARGYDPDTDREKLAEVVGHPEMKKHNSLWDARVLKSAHWNITNHLSKEEKPTI